MSVYTCEFIYQGYPCLKGSFKRSDGLAPEGGAVYIPLEKLGGLEIMPPAVPWRATRGFEFESMGEIGQFCELVKPTMTADRDPAPEPSGGLFLFGDLDILTRTESGDIYDQIRYSDIYVDAGVEEETRDLQDILAHSEGVVRIPLTDIRQYYKDYGALFARINCRTKSGAWDLSTVKKDGKPYNVTEIIEFLFSQLPGSPQVLEASEFRTLHYENPQGIEGRGEPAVQCLQRVLDNLGLKAQMQPSGDYLVTPKWSKRITENMICPEAGQTVEIFRGEINYERKSATATGRPAAVAVVGGRRVMRMSWNWIPVLPDTDGKYYRLEELVAKWGYSMAKLNKQIFASPDNQFWDCPPQDGGDNLHYERVQILKKAYKLYLPGFLSIWPTTGIDLAELNIENEPFLPIVPCAFYESELTEKMRKEIPVWEKKQADAEEKFYIRGPIARGDRVIQQFFPSFAAAERSYNGLKARLTDELKTSLKLKTLWEDQMAEAANYLAMADEYTKDSLAGIKAGKFGTIIMPPLEIGQERIVFAPAVGKFLEAEAALVPTKNSYAALKTLSTCKKAVETADKDLRINDIQAAIASHEGKWTEFKKVYEKHRGFPCRFNSGQTVLPASVKIEPRTGLLESSVPLCHIKAPYFFDGDAQEVVADGGVVVTFGYEVKGNNVGAFTNFIFFGDDGDDYDAEAVVKFAGCCRSTPIKCPVVSMESRLYCLENGAPVNLNACFAEAHGKAASQLRQSRRVPAWVLELIGMRKCVLDGGVCSVQHIWDGDSGTTHVSVNAPAARMPLLPANIVRSRAVDQARLRETLQRESNS